MEVCARLRLAYAIVYACSNGENCVYCNAILSREWIWQVELADIMSVEVLLSNAVANC